MVLDIGVIVLLLLPPKEKFDITIRSMFNLRGLLTGKQNKDPLHSFEQFCECISE